MYSSKKGFLFIEGSIMILLAGMGTISAAMFPAMTGYLEKSRDTARISHLNTIATALQIYYSDRETYPETPSSGCIPKDALKVYLPYVPQDPQTRNLSSGCDGSDGMTYAYTSYIDVDNIPHFILGATMEGERNGNSPIPMNELDVTNTGITFNSFVRGSGKEYIIFR